MALYVILWSLILSPLICKDSVATYTNKARGLCEANVVLAPITTGDDFFFPLNSFYSLNLGIWCICDRSGNKAQMCQNCHRANKQRSACDRYNHTPAPTICVRGWGDPLPQASRLAQFAQLKVDLQRDIDLAAPPSGLQPLNLSHPSKVWTIQQKEGEKWICLLLTYTAPGKEPKRWLLVVNMTEDWADGFLT